MARSVQEIAERLKGEFVSNGLLQEVYGLESGKSFDEQFSRTSIEARLIDVFASASWLLENIWDSFKMETETLVDASYVMGETWYYNRALEFQTGGRLVYDGNTCRFTYDKVDEDARVVRNVAVRQVVDGGVTKLKIYFSDAQKQPIEGDIRKAFETYMREIGAAGTHYLFVSQAPDELRVHLHVYYDPLVLDSTGERLKGGGKPVEETIRGYLDNLEYGGVFYASRLVDALQVTEGVRDITLDATTWKSEREYKRRIDSDSGAFVYVKNEGDIVYLID